MKNGLNAELMQNKSYRTIKRILAYAQPYIAHFHRDVESSPALEFS